jgi:hypothetical protein
MPVASKSAKKPLQSRGFFIYNNCVNDLNHVRDKYYYLNS